MVATICGAYCLACRAVQGAANNHSLMARADSRDSCAACGDSRGLFGYDLCTTDQTARGATATDTRYRDRTTRARGERLSRRIVRILQQSCSEHYGVRRVVFSHLRAQQTMADTLVQHAAVDAVGSAELL